MLPSLCDRQGLRSRHRHRILLAINQLYTASSDELRRPETEIDIDTLARSTTTASAVRRRGTHSSGRPSRAWIAGDVATTWTLRGYAPQPTARTTPVQVLRLRGNLVVWSTPAAGRPSDRPF